MGRRRQRRHLQEGASQGGQGRRRRRARCRPGRALRAGRRVLLRPRRRRCAHRRSRCRAPR
eukprot:4551734-Pleurochrysis_carterae.AAC.1